MDDCENKPAWIIVIIQTVNGVRTVYSLVSAVC